MSKCPNEGRPCYCTGACRGEKPSDGRYKLKPKIINHWDGVGVSINSIKSRIRGDIINRGMKMRGNATIEGASLKIDEEQLAKILSGHVEVKRSGCLWDSVDWYNPDGSLKVFSMSCNCPKCSAR